MPVKFKSVPVSERALLQRINRKLEPKHQRIMKARGRAVSQCGEFYKLDTYGNSVRETHISLEKIGRELKVLAPWESLTKEMRL
jgi:hypothetical protein